MKDLTPFFPLLSIAVAAYTGGMGAGMLGGTSAAVATTAANAATLMGSTAFGAAANVGFASLSAAAMRAHRFVPAIGDRGQVRIGGGAELFDERWQRVGEVLVFAFAETVTDIMTRLRKISSCA